MQPGDQNPNFFLYAFFIVIMLCLKIFILFPLLKLFHCFFLNWVMLRTSAQAPTFCSQKFKTGETYLLHRTYSGFSKIGLKKTAAKADYGTG